MSREAYHRFRGDARTHRIIFRRWIQNPNAIKPGCLMPAMRSGGSEVSRADRLYGDSPLMPAGSIAWDGAIARVKRRPLVETLHADGSPPSITNGLASCMFSMPWFFSSSAESKLTHHADPAHSSAERFCFATRFQPDVHHAWDHHDLFRGHADGVWVRELSGAPDDRRAGYGVPPFECVSASG